MGLGEREETMGVVGDGDKGIGVDVGFRAGNGAVLVVGNPVEGESRKNEAVSAVAMRRIATSLNCSSNSPASTQ